MVSKKSSRGPQSQISSATSLATASNTQAANKSSIFRSSFSPSHYQLALFADVIQGFDSQHLRIHNTLTGRLRCDHAIGSKATINSLDWGYYGGKHGPYNQQQSKKKRKRNHEVNGDAGGDAGGDVVVAFGTSDSDIQMFSPTEDRIIAKLQGAHTQGIRDFKFTNRDDSAEGWSLGGDGKLTQWDLRTGTSKRTLSIPTMSAYTLARPVPTHPSVICASETAYIIDPDSVGLKQTQAFPGSVNRIHTILTSLPSGSRLSDKFLAAADSARQMNVFDIKKGRLVGSLIAENDVQSVALYAGAKMDMQTSDGRAIQDGRYLSSQVLAAVTSDGIVELFPRPFEGFDHVQSSSNPANLKAQRQQMTRKKEATVKIIRPDKSSTVVNVINADFQGADLVMVWTEGGVNVLFERVRWQDEDTGELLLRGTKEIVRGKSGSGLGATVMNGVKDLGKSKVDDSQAVVVNGGDLEDVPMTGQDHEVIEVSSGEDDISEGEGGHGEEADQAASNQDKEMKDAQQDGNEVEGEEQATFGDLLWAAAPGAVDVSAAFDDAESKAVVQSSTNRSLQLPTGMSLGTVLTQSLKTNDTNLLETCLHTKDLGMIRATIERLESALAAALLQKLAERLHSRPGRAGNLMVWIQWTLICHGGYLAGQPELMKKLSSLHRVVKERASSLQPLLSLKGKLDMLEAQMNLRRSMQANARAAHAIDEDDEEGVIYVEGQDDSDSEADSVEVQSEREVSGYRRPGRAITVTGHESQDASNIDEDEEDSDDDDNMPTTLNGVIPDSEEDDDSGSEADLIDDEASETGEDSGDDLSDDEVDHEDVDSVDGDNASDIDSPPAKRIIKPQLENGVRTKK